MNDRFDAYLAGRVATAPTLGASQGDRPWARFRLAVDDRMRNAGMGGWETSQTVLHDVVVFGKLAERTTAMLRTGDPVLVQGELRFQSCRSADGRTRTGTSVVASRIGPDLLLADVTVFRDRQLSAQRPQGISNDIQPTIPGRSL